MIFSKKLGHKTYMDWLYYAKGKRRWGTMTKTYFDRVVKAHKKYPEGTLKQLGGHKVLTDIYEYTYFTPYEVEARTWYEIRRDGDPYNDAYMEEARKDIMTALDRHERGFRTSAFQDTLEYKGVRKYAGEVGTTELFSTRTRWKSKMSKSGRKIK